MDDDDYRALIEVLAAELMASGAGDIADQRHYARLDDEYGEARLLDPQKRVIEMLAAFERKVATEDRETFRLALARMQSELRGGTPRGAVVELTVEDDRAPTYIDLAQAPDLGEVRSDLRDLLARIAESRLPPGELF